MAPLLSFQVANSGINIPQHAYQEVSTATLALALSLLQFMRHATKALRCNGFVDGPNSAGSFYVLSYHTLL